MSSPPDQLGGEGTVPAPSRFGRRQIVTAAVVVLALAAIGVALGRGWSRVAEYDWRLQPAWLVLGTVLVLISYGANAVTYARSVEWLTPVHPTRLAAVSIWARSLLARYIPGNVMMLVGRAVLSYDHGVPRRVTLAATVYEQALALGVGTVGAVIFLVAYGNPGDGRLLWLLLVVPIVLAALHPAPFRRISTWALTRMRRPPLDTLFTGRQVLGLLALYAAGTVPLVVGVWALVHAAAGPRAGGVFEVGLAFLLAFVISFLAFVLPSGIGVRDGILAVAFARNLPGSVALAVAVGLRFALILVEILFVALASFLGRRAGRRRTR